MRKKMYIIGGTMGVGKTTTCQSLKNILVNSVFLDGDWCWDMHPFQVTSETKTMVLKNICYLLNNYLHCSAYENIIFCWVMHKQSVIDKIMSKLEVTDCDVEFISLVCDEAALRQRLQNGVDEGLRTADVIARSVARIPLYDKLDTLKIDVTKLSAIQAAQKIADL